MNEEFSFIPFSSKKSEFSGQLLESLSIFIQDFQIL